MTKRSQQQLAQQAAMLAGGQPTITTEPESEVVPAEPADHTEVETEAAMEPAGQANNAEVRNSVSPQSRSSAPARKRGPAKSAPKSSTTTRTAAAAGASRVEPVKVTVAMSPVEHRKLRTWCALTAAELELPQVAGAEVLRVLWNMAQADPELNARLQAEIAQTGGTRRR